MESLLLMAASLIALGGAVLHGYVGGRIYMRHVRSSDLMPLTQSLSLVSWQMFYDVSVSQWRHVDLRRRET